jgi:putative transposase
VYGVSERRACRVLQLGRSTKRYEGVRRDDVVLRMRLRELAHSRPRFGYRRLLILLRREGFAVNHKRVHRLYRLEGLTVRIRRRKKLASMARVAPATASRRNERWVMDFVSDALADGRKFRVLTVVDAFTRECVALEVDHGLPAARVTRALDVAIARRRRPEVITIDNGTEFTSNHFDAWAYEKQIRLDFIRPGKPIENAFAESFNGRFRDECLSASWFTGLDDARRTVEDWRRDYNESRPHSALGGEAPTAFASRLLAPGPAAERR